MQASVHSVCTITTLGHEYKTKAWLTSALQWHPDVTAHVLLIDDNNPRSADHRIQYYTLSDLNSELAQAIINKYRHRPDALRWSLKSIFALHLLSQGQQNVLYFDNDIWITHQYDFLFQALNKNSFLLTPHHYPIHTTHSQNWLEANFRVGLYNAGFFGVNAKATATLEWWAGACLYKCEKNYFRGLFDDQKYLDLVPIICQDTLILQHPGCNVASWNVERCPRTLVDRQVMLSEQFPLVFVHFNFFTIREIIEGRDPLLTDTWNQYFAALKKYAPTLEMKQLYHPATIIERLKLFIWKLATGIAS